MKAIRGNILTSSAEAIAIPVNCVGVAGAGLAKAWRDADPEAYRVYRDICEARMIIPGGVGIIDRWRLCATKDHWRNLSRAEWIRSCIGKLWCDPAQSLAIPLLGAGLGGLRPQDVFMMIKERFGEDDREIEVWLGL